MVTGVTWTGAVHWIGTASGLLSAVVLGRLLRPADFAVLAAANALGAFMGIVQESGLGAAVVHQPGDEDRNATTALVLNVVLATLGVALCVALSPWLAGFFRIEQPAALAVAFTPLWMRAWVNVPIARMQRVLAFGRCAVATVVPSLVYPAVSIPLALAGTGPWALVLGQSVAALGGVAAAWALVRWRPRLRDLDWEAGKRLAAYGRPLTGSNLLAMLNDQVDNWVIGGLFGPAALGLYAMAFRLATLPRSGFTFVVSTVLFPALSRLRAEPDRFRQAFVGSLHWVALVSVPASVGMALVAPELIGVVLGPRWAGAIGATRILAAFGLLAALSATTGDVFKATGRSHLVLRIGLVHSAALWCGLAALARGGLPWVALAVSLATLASTLVAFWCALRITGLGAGAILGALRVPLGATLAMAGAMLLGRHVLALAPLPTLLALVAIGAAVYVAAVWLLAPDEVADVRALLGGLGQRRLTARPGPRVPERPLR